ncbi:hypothetical protein GF389_01245 [Candidatus Dojkabacteria bacterium]|nr:hypothetical protein [Candidatus Dojkabacteria bacterium]
MNLKKDTNWMHFTGIAGVTLAPLAIELKKLGYKVTGTDENLYDPIKGIVEGSTIDVFEKFSYENLTRNGNIPNLLVTGAGVSEKNKELLFAKKQGITVKHFAEVLEELLIENNSIVIAGTYAKTTITAMLVAVLKEAEVETSYMFGGVPVDGSSSIHLKTNKTLLSVVEGDEYIASRWDLKSKFYFYHPKYLILTVVKWDHTDVFTSEKDYIENFRNLVKQVPEDGAIFANFADKNVVEVIESARCKVFKYKPDDVNKWADENKITVSVLGSFNETNAAVAAKFAVEVLNLDIVDVQVALKNFEGIKRRLEVRYASPGKKLHEARTIVLDDFASSTAKVQGAIRAIKDEFPKHQLVVVYEPNTGNRTKRAVEEFVEVFQGAEIVFLPKFKELIKSRKTKFLNENEFGDFLKEKVNVEVQGSDSELVDKILKRSRNTKTVIAFMSSQGMSDRIQLLLSKL